MCVLSACGEYLEHEHSRIYDEIKRSESSVPFPVNVVEIESKIHEERPDGEDNLDCTEQSG